MRSERNIKRLKEQKERLKLKITDVELLKTQYLEMGMTGKQLSSFYGFKIGVVKRILRENGIKKRMPFPKNLSNGST